MEIIPEDGVSRIMAVFSVSMHSTAPEKDHTTTVFTGSSSLDLVNVIHIACMYMLCEPSRKVQRSPAFPSHLFLPYVKTLLLKRQMKGGS